jgi:glycosyltransferase involved in cell wall biosynthesis
MSGPGDGSMNAATHGPSVLCVGGEDHHLRIPFLLALLKRGFRVTAAGTGASAPFDRAGLPYRSFQFDRFVNPAADARGVRLIRGLLDDLSPSIVQSFDTKPNILVPLAAAKRPGVKVVRTINGMGWVYSSRGPLALTLRPLQRMLHRWAGRKTHATVFQNTQDKAFFESHGLVPAGHTLLIPGSGIDIEGFDRAIAARQPSSGIAGLGEMDGVGVVITVTRLNRAKGIPTLLTAAELVHRVRPNVRFLLVGPRESDGPSAISDAEIEGHAPYVVATGPRQDVPALLSRADVFAFPTEYREGVPRALLEAALAGLPIVTTDMPGCTDVVTDGVSGIVVPVRSPAPLAEGILAMLRDRSVAREMGHRAAARVRRDFGLDLTVTRYANLYWSLLTNTVPLAEPALPARAPESFTSS